jgi:hypothetical protein
MAGSIRSSAVRVAAAACNLLVKATGAKRAEPLAPVLPFALIHKEIAHRWLSGSAARSAAGADGCDQFAGDACGSD